MPQAKRSLSPKSARRARTKEAPPSAEAEPKAPSTSLAAPLAPVPPAPEPERDDETPAVEDVTPAADSAPAEKTYELERNERTSIKLYLNEIGQIPLLKPEEEVELAGRIKKGDKAARDRMIRCNLRLVVKIAHDYKDFGLPLVDLISEGNIGLIKAVERFDPTKGGKLSTYAAWWIKQAIKRALANQSKTIRLPVHLVDKISRMRRVAAQLNDELEREPTDDELAEVMNIPVHKIAHLKTVSSRPASLDAPVGDSEDSTRFGELVGDENAPTPFESLREKGKKADLAQMLADLEPREAEILRLRFGFDGEDEMTLEDVGEKFRITRERVRQLQNIALSKLRRAITDRESQRTIDEVEEAERLRKRNDVIRDFIQSRKK
jgi:RNA polymerase primary sigma factor